MSMFLSERMDPSIHDMSELRGAWTEATTAFTRQMDPYFRDWSAVDCLSSMHHHVNSCFMQDRSVLIGNGCLRDTMRASELLRSCFMSLPNLVRERQWKC